MIRKLWYLILAIAIDIYFCNVTGFDVNQNKSLLLNKYNILLHDSIY